MTESAALSSVERIEADQRRRHAAARALAHAFDAETVNAVRDAVTDRADQLHELITRHRITGPIARVRTLLERAALDLTAVRDARAELLREQVSAAKLPTAPEPDRDDEGERMLWRHVALRDVDTEPLEGYRILRRNARVHITAAEARELAAELLAAADLDDARSAQ